MGAYWNYRTQEWRIVYPFPTVHGIAQIDLPDEPLSEEDAERLAAFIRTLPIHTEAEVRLTR